MARILVVVESINVNDSSASKGRVALIKNLKACNYDLKVYHYTRKEIVLEGIPCVAIKEKRLTPLAIVNKLQLMFYKLTKVRLSKSFEKWAGFSFSFLNDVHSIKSALKKEKDFEPDWVLTLSKAASFAAHKAVLDFPQWHSKWLAYVHDPYPFHFYPRPYNWVEPGYFQKQEFFRDVSRKCAFAIFPSQLLKEWVGSYFPGFLDNGIVIPHQIQDDYKESNKTTAQFFNKEGFTILHAGNLMKPRDPKGLIEGFKLFLSHNEEASRHTQLLLLGNQEYFKTYLNSAKKSLEQLYVSDNYVAYADVLAMQNAASVNVILEAKSEISPFLPGKFPHCVRADRPILYLGPRYSETLRLLGEDYPFSSEIDKPHRIAQLLEQLYKQWQIDNHLSRLNRTDLVEYLSVDNLYKTIHLLDYKDDKKN